MPVMPVLCGNIPKASMYVKPISPIISAEIGMENEKGVNEMG
jgi:hypothetical protein